MTVQEKHFDSLVLHGKHWTCRNQVGQNPLTPAAVCERRPKSFATDFREFLLEEA